MLCNKCRDYRSTTTAAKAFLDQMGEGDKDGTLRKMVSEVVHKARADYMAHLTSHTHAELIEIITR